MNYEVDINAELAKLGLYFEPKDIPDAHLTAPLFWRRWDSGAWEEVLPDRGNRYLSRADAYRATVLAAPGRDCEAFEIATKAADDAVFVADGLPIKKGTVLREAVVLRHNRQYPQIRPNEQRVPFRSIQRLAWTWGRAGLRPGDVHFAAANAGIGERVFICPRDVVIDPPAELNGAAKDRVKDWESRAKRLVQEALDGGKLAADLDVEAIASEAYDEHKARFAEAPLPELVKTWSESAQEWYRRTLEVMVSTYGFRHTEAPERAIQAVADQCAKQIAAGQRLI